jgi:hypothetical protein
LALTWTTSGCRSVGIVRWRAQTTESSLGLVLIWDVHNAYHMLAQTTVVHTIAKWYYYSEMPCFS